MSVHRHDLTDAEWERLAPLLPPEKPKTGKPNKSHRLVLNAILWKLRTGAPWRDIPQVYGPWQTAYTRFRRWQRAGVWERLFGTVLQQADAAGQLDWSLHFVDGTVIRAHQHAAGAKGGALKRRPLGGAKAALAPKSISAARAMAARSRSS
jgi:transposase